MNYLFKILKEKPNGLYSKIINFQVRTLFLLVIFLDTHPLYSQGSNNDRSNIIVITTDQQSADAMSFFMGKRWINTPAMDELASQGVVFRNAYAANPLCAPSRNSIITGQLPHITGIEANDGLFNFRPKEPGRDWTSKDFKSIGTYFKNAGYETAYFGKWHLNYDTLDKKSHGFETTRFTSGRGDDAALPASVNNFLSQPHEKPFLGAEDFSSAARKILGMASTYQERVTHHAAFFSSINSFLRKRHAEIKISLFDQAKTNEIVIATMSTIKELNYYGCDGRPWSKGDGGQLEATGKTLLDNGPKFLHAAKENHVKSLLLMENHNLQSVDFSLLEKGIPKVIAMNPDQLIYYYYPRNVDDPEREMAIIGNALKKYSTKIKSLQ